MKFHMISALVALGITFVNGQLEPLQDTADSFRKALGFKPAAVAKAGKPVARAGASMNCVASKMNPSDMPVSYNDKSSGFFVDMGLILTDYYGLNSSISKLQLNVMARTFTKPIKSFQKAQSKEDNLKLYNSVTGLLKILIDHTVNDTYISRSDWDKYNIDRDVFSQMQVNDLLRKRGKLLSLAQERDNGSDEVIRKEVAVRKMQLKIFEAKGSSSINSIIAGGIKYEDYRKRFSDYMWNICAQTQDRETIRQVRNHFAFWLSQGYEDEESKAELDSTYKESSSSSFSYPEGLKFSLVSGICTLLGAVAIGLFMTA